MPLLLKGTNWTDRHAAIVGSPARWATDSRGGRRVFAHLPGHCPRLTVTGLTVNPRLSAHTFSATVIIRADTSDSTYERTAGASFCKSCLATIAK